VQNTNKKNAASLTKLVDFIDLTEFEDIDDSINQPPPACPPPPPVRHQVFGRSLISRITVIKEYFRVRCSLPLPRNPQRLI